MLHSRLIKYILFASLAFSALPSLSAAASDAENEKMSVERYALYVASNNGGAKRETLKYAGTDALRLAQTMNDIGGIKAENSLILTDPTKAEIDGAFRNFKTLIERNKGTSKRSEFLFYYSGHSDENAFLLGNEIYNYEALKESLNTVPSDVHVVMLDSCFSGNFVRTKGGSRQKAFLMDDSAIVQGHAYLSSSADNEASQESDIIQASYFTQALVTGLRGAADSSGDGKVSLNELYYYAFNETLSSTELSSVGPQHPSYNITLVGSGDLVLTDLSEAESAVYIPSDSEGKYFFRNKDNLLVSEINKLKGTEIALALPAGFYSITLIAGNTTRQRNIVLMKGERVPLESYTFSNASLIPGRARGDAESVLEEAKPEEDVKWTPISVSFFPGFAFPETAGTDNVNVSIGIFMAQNKRIFGIQANAFGGTITGDLNGVQASGFMNNNSGNGKGLQAAGFMNNNSGDFYGVQASGFMNNASGSIRGGQWSGFMNNLSGSIQGIQVTGFMNNASGSVIGVQSSGFTNNTGGSIIGIQASGFLNTASRGFTGLQAAGFLNIASGESNGAQVSGFLNIARDISGVQIGIVNIARKNSGAPIGIFNIILDGIISPAVYIDTNENAFIQYQGGTNLFFTTFIAGTNMNWKMDYAIFGFGIGTRIHIGPLLSLDLEILEKQIIDADGISINDNPDMTDAEKQTEAERVGRILAKSTMPSARATLNFSFVKHLTVFASVNADCNIIGFNDRAFTYGLYENSYIIKKDIVQIFPSLSLGLKF